MNSRSALFIFAAALLAGACSPQSTSPTSEPPTSTFEGVITIGDIANQPSDVIEAFQRLADYRAASLGGFGVGVGEVRVAPGSETMTRMVAGGDVDIYFDSPYPGLLVSEGSGASPILRRWKDGIEEYHSVIFTPAQHDLE